VDILEPGKLPDEKWTGRCPNCHCKVRCLKSETSYFDDPREGGGRYVKCPTRGCGKDIWLKEVTE
jgi:hypothetical protein